MLIEQLVGMNKQDGMTLEKAAKLIVKQLGIVRKMNEEQEKDGVPYLIQQFMQQQYSAIFEQLNQVQQAKLWEVENRLVERIEKEKN